MIETKRPLRVFLCHASGDKPAVRELYDHLVKDGIDAWLDREKLIPGQDWQIEITKAVKNSDVVIVCLSSQSLTKEGFVQREIKFALDAADEKPDGTIFIIPARLENCEVPERIGRFHWVDLFAADGYEWLIKALQIRANNLGLTTKPKRKPARVIKREPSAIIEEPLSNSLHVMEVQPSNASRVQESKRPSVVEVKEFEKQRNFFVIFADEKKMRSMTKIFPFNDIGMFRVGEFNNKFDGLRLSIAFPSINQISITRQQIPWVGHFLLNALTFGAMIIFTLLFINYTVPQTVVLSYVSSIIFIIALIVFLFFISFVFSAIYGYVVKWVKIDYSDVRGEHHVAYFSAISLLGYSIFFKRTELLYRILVDHKKHVSIKDD